MIICARGSGAVMSGWAAPLPLIARWSLDQWRRSSGTRRLSSSRAPAGARGILVQSLRPATGCELDLARKQLARVIGLKPWILQSPHVRFTASTIRNKPLSNVSSDARRCCRSLQNWRGSWLGLKLTTRPTIGDEKSPRVGDVLLTPPQFVKPYVKSQKGRSDLADPTSSR
jgi:hypothetical protein